MTICAPPGDVIIGERWRGSDKKSSNEDATDHDIMSSFALCSLLWKMFLSVIIVNASMISFVGVIDIAAGLPTIGVFSISHIYPDAESVVGWF